MKKILRAEWVRAGYDKRMGSAEVVPPPTADFIRVYHFLSAEFAIANVGLARLKVARFSDLNDLFELLALNFKERPSRKVISDFKSEYDNRSGLLCFSANWTTPVMWSSHYGNRHRGICLGFNLRRKLAQPISYEDKRLLAKLDADANPLKLDKKLQRSLLCTKYRHWEYEREVRVFVELDQAIQEGRLHFWRFSQDLNLREVILGPLCTLPLDGVRELVAARHPGAVVFQSRLAFKSFNVVPLESTVP